MRIPGSPPVAPTRAARAYGIQPRPAPTTAPTAGPDAAGGEGLRAVLTDEERAYFDRIAALGPVTYGPGRRQAAPADAPRGLRLDVTG